MVIVKINNLCEYFNPANELDNELYFEKLVRMAKKLKKRKERRQKGQKKKFSNGKTITLVGFFIFNFFFFFFFFLILLTEQATCKYFTSNFAFFI